MLTDEKIYDVVGVGEYKDVIFATCTSEKHAKRAIQMLRAEGVLAEFKEKELNVLKNINGLKKKIEPLLY